MWPCIVLLESRTFLEDKLKHLHYSDHSSAGRCEQRRSTFVFNLSADRLSLKLIRWIKSHLMGKRWQLRVSDGHVSFIVGRFILNVQQRSWWLKSANAPENEVMQTQHGHVGRFHQIPRLWAIKRVQCFIHASYGGRCRLTRTFVLICRISHKVLTNFIYLSFLASFAC